MPKTAWNDDEDSAMDYLPHCDQLIYLRGIRRRMDFRTGISGITAPVSYTWLSQLAEVRSRRGSNSPVPRRMGREAIRAVLRRLEDAGLIRWIKTTGPGLVIECLLADTDRIRAEEEQPQHNPSTTPPEQPQKNKKKQRVSANDQPQFKTPVLTKHNPIPDSDVREDKIGTSYLVPASPNGGRKQDLVAEILDHLNAATGGKFRAFNNSGKRTKSAELIRDRLREYDAAELFAVIDAKTAEWSHDDKMRLFLRPSTLFGKEKCSQYVGQLSLTPTKTAEQLMDDALDDWANGESPVIDGEFTREH